MYKRIAAAAAVILLASAIVVFSTRVLSDIVPKVNHIETVIYQHSK